MPTKPNSSGKQQPYDPETGKYTQFSNFHKPRDYNKEIAELKQQQQGLSRFNPKSIELGEKIRQLEAESKGFNSYNEMLQKQHNQNQQKIIKNAKEKENVDEKDIKNLYHKQKQLEIINKFNPMQDDYHTGIRKISDIKDAEEVFSNKNDFIYPDFTQEDGENALKKGYVMVYSSKPIEQGGFVSPSKMMAQDYAGNNRVYSKYVRLDEVAWLDSSEGQYAKI